MLCPSCHKWECLAEDQFCGLCASPLKRVEFIPAAVAFVGGARNKPARLTLRNGGISPLTLRVGQTRASRDFLKIEHPEADRKRVGWTKMVASVETGQALPHPQQDAEISLPVGAEYGVDVKVEGPHAQPGSDLLGVVLVAGEGLTDHVGKPVSTKPVPVTWGVPPEPRLIVPGDINCVLGRRAPSFDVRISNPKHGFATLKEAPRVAVDWMWIRDYPTDPIQPGLEGTITVGVDPSWAPQGTHKVEMTVKLFELEAPLTATLTVSVRQPPELVILPPKLNLRELSPFSLEGRPFHVENRGEEDLMILGEPTIEPATLRGRVTVKDEDPSLRRIKSVRVGHPGKPFSLHVSTEGLTAGDYVGSVKVASNDPSNETVELPFSFSVVELQPCDKVLALDFGTSNCCMAHAVNHEDCYPIDLAGGGQREVFEIPTVVYFKGPGEYVIGEEAKNTQRMSPELTVSSVKRLLGGTRQLKILGKAYTPREIAAIIIRKLWERAAVALKQAPRELILTVPCNFSDPAVNDLLAACKEAGFAPKVDRSFILDEPAAAAYRYVALYSHELAAKGKDCRLLVYDFGGGTLDIALIAVQFKEDGKVRIRVMEVDGVDLGGDDLDLELVKMYVEQLKKDQEGNAKSKVAKVSLERIIPGENESEDELDADTLHNRAVLRRAAEDVKKSLSRDPEAPFPGALLKDRLGNAVQLEKGDPILLTRRADFEERITPLLQNSFDVMMGVIERAETGPDRVNVLLLTGGSSQIPLVQAGVPKLFPNATVPPAKHIPPKQSVALGAATYAFLSVFGDEITIESMRDRTRFSIGTLDGRGRFREILHRGAPPLFEEFPTKLPSKPTQLRLVRYNGATNAKFFDAKQLEDIGSVEIDPALLGGVPEGAEAVVEFFLKEDRTLEATLKLKATGGGQLADGSHAPPRKLTGRPLKVSLKEGALR